MGFSLKKIGKAAAAVVKKPGNVLKKVAVTAEGAAAGFLAGGPVGAAAGGAAGAIKASKTGKAPALNLRTVYQTAAAGGAAGLAAAVTTNALQSGGAKALTGKIVSFSKSGGLAKNALPALGKLSARFGKFSKSAGEAITDAAQESVAPASGAKPDFRHVWNEARDFARGRGKKVLSAAEEALAPETTAVPGRLDSGPGGNGWLGPVAIAGATLFLM